MGKELFGTDGIRGVAGEYPLDAATVHAFGRALGSDLRRASPDAAVLIGMDTRESGPWIAAQVAAGLCIAGRARGFRRRHHHARRGLSDALRFVHRRRHDLGLAQSVSR
jgi:phosphoglucomutase